MTGLNLLFSVEILHIFTRNNGRSKYFFSLQCLSGNHRLEKKHFLLRKFLFISWRYTWESQLRYRKTYLVAIGMTKHWNSLPRVDIKISSGKDFKNCLSNLVSKITLVSWCVMKFGDRLDKLLKSLLSLFPMIFQVGVWNSLGNKGTLRYCKIRPKREERLCYAEVSDDVEFGKQYAFFFLIKTL